jgi:hypothetical protein
MIAANPDGRSSPTMLSGGSRPEFCAPEQAGINCQSVSRRGHAGSQMSRSLLGVDLEAPMRRLSGARVEPVERIENRRLPKPEQQENHDEIHDIGEGHQGYGIGQNAGGEAFAAMAAYHEDLVKAGVLLDASGLQPSSKGWRVKYGGGKRTVIEGRGARVE